MFLVQPLVAKLSMPLLGGTPAVWAIAMCFFQAMLLCGYGYAHLLRKITTPLQGLIIHSLLLFAAVLLPIGKPETAVPITGVMAGVELFWIFIKVIGFPFFVLSATAPLLQSWFGRLNHPYADNPYFLYAASNIGSIGALLVYPTLIEPLLPVDQQVHWWSVMFSVLVVCILVCGHLHLLHAAPARPAATASAPVEAITAERRFFWVVMAFIPSALLVAWSNYLSADIASAPFLWLPPLILFLLTFILEFRERPPIPAKLLKAGQILFVPATLLFQFGLHMGNIVIVLAVTAISFFASALICHRQLYNARPSASHLTDFYMMMSLGGVLGGLFVSLVSPVIFSTYVEYPVLLMAGLLLRGPLDPENARKTFPISPLFVGKLVTGAVAVFLLLSIIPWRIGGSPLEMAVLGLVPLGFFLVRQPKSAGFAVVVIAMLLNVGRIGEVASLRNYFGSLGVLNSPDGSARWLRHGTTLHGAELVTQIAPDFIGRPEPLTYYSPSGGLSKAVRVKQDLLRIKGRAGDYGIIGLGTGSMACLAQKGENWHFYEIDSDVVRVARNPAYFTFLSRCGENVTITEGDARLSIQSEPAGRFDYLLVDAFSSDSIPTHLLTAEAMSLYQRRLKPDGILVFHLSNRFMDLPPVVAATAKLALPGFQNRLIIDTAPSKPGVSASVSMVLTPDLDALRLLDQSHPGAKAAATNNVVPWTDNFTNVTAAILRNYFNNQGK